jgi:4-hydroxymandelate oxidase
VRLRPRVLRDVAAVSTSTTVLGTPVASPVLAAPVGYLRLAHPQGEAAWAAGAAAAGALRVLSSRSSTRVADVAAVAPGAPWWFQVYIMRDRQLTAELVRRAVATGATALALTGDTPRLGSKRRGGVGLPPGAFMPDLAAGGDEDLREDPRAAQDPATTFADVGWLREISGVPVLVKGVLRGDDARACVDAGAAGVIVSNHGGRQLDGAVATADALAEVADAVAGEAEVYVDGGVRSGVDVLRALGLGARGVLVGRPLVWALAAGGAAGVRDLLTALGAELEEALALAGARSPADVGRDLVAPPG